MSKERFITITEEDRDKAIAGLNRLSEMFEDSETIIKEKNALIAEMLAYLKNLDPACALCNGHPSAKFHSLQCEGLKPLITKVEGST